MVFFMVVGCVAAFDLWLTKMLLELGYSPGVSKGIATALSLLLNYTGRRYIVFPSSGRRSWNSRIRIK
jgi:putative flippase GtrA